MLPNAAMVLKKIENSATTATKIQATAATRIASLKPIAAKRAAPTSRAMVCTRPAARSVISRLPRRHFPKILRLIMRFAAQLERCLFPGARVPSILTWLVRDRWERVRSASMESRVISAARSRALNLMRAAEPFAAIILKKVMKNAMTVIPRMGTAAPQAALSRILVLTMGNARLRAAASILTERLAAPREFAKMDIAV